MKPSNPTTLQDLPSRPVQAIHPDTSLMEAAQIMDRLQTEVLPVCEEHRFVGLITVQEIALYAAAQGQDPKATVVRDVMEPDPEVSRDPRDLVKCFHYMEQREIQHMPVLGPEDRLIGILSLLKETPGASKEPLTRSCFHQIPDPNHGVLVAGH